MKRLGRRAQQQLQPLERVEISAELNDALAVTPPTHESYRRKTTKNILKFMGGVGLALTGSYITLARYQDHATEHLQEATELTQKEYRAKEIIDGLRSLDQFMQQRGANTECAALPPAMIMFVQTPENLQPQGVDAFVAQFPTFVDKSLALQPDAVNGKKVAFCGDKNFDNPDDIAAYEQIDDQVRFGVEGSLMLRPGYDLISPEHSQAAMSEATSDYIHDPRGLAFALASGGMLALTFAICYTDQMIAGLDKQRRY